MIGRVLTTILLAAAMAACSTAPPEGLSPVRNFDIQQYEGRWYEIARLDHRFERGLSNVTADYALQDDGTVSVLNRGYNEEEQAWEEAEGTARFLGSSDVGSLEVSFFGPFYGGYHIIALDQDNYQWAMITGASRDYLWIMSRQPTLDEAIYDTLTAQARDSGFPMDELIVVDQGRNRQ